MATLNILEKYDVNLHKPDFLSIYYISRKNIMNETINNKC